MCSVSVQWTEIAAKKKQVCRPWPAASRCVDHNSRIPNDAFGIYKYTVNIVPMTQQEKSELPRTDPWADDLQVISHHSHLQLVALPKLSIGHVQGGPSYSRPDSSATLCEGVRKWRKKTHTHKSFQPNSNGLQPNSDGLRLDPRQIRIGRWWRTVNVRGLGSRFWEEWQLGRCGSVENPKTAFFVECCKD